MEKETIKLITDWFYSDLNIEFDLKYKKQKGLLILESDVYYYDGHRYKGRHRYIIYDDDYDNESDLYKLFTEIRKDYPQSIDLEGIINFLKDLESNSIKIDIN